ATELVPFPAAAAPAPGKPAADLSELKGPLEIAVLDKAGNALARPQSLTVTYRQPRDYIAVVALPEFVRAQNRLTMQVRPVKEAPAGRSCTVRMRLACKDLLRFGDNDMTRTLDPDGGPVTLSVRDLEFDEQAANDPSGWVYLDVDGFERAVVYSM